MEKVHVLRMFFENLSVGLIVWGVDYKLLNRENIRQGYIFFIIEKKQERRPYNDRKLEQLVMQSSDPAQG